MDIELTFEDIFDDNADLVCILNLQHTIIRANHAMAKRMGVTKEELIGQNCCFVFHHAEKPPEYCPQLQLMKDGMKHNAEIWFEQLNAWFQVTVSPLHDTKGNLIGSIHISHDISERKRTETELALVNRVLLMLSDANQTLIHVRDEGILLNEICRIAVEVGGYRMAWVGFADQNEGKIIRREAKASGEPGYIEPDYLSWLDDGDHGLGPGGIAIRTGQPYIVHNIHMDPVFDPWRDEAIKHGFHSLIALPLTNEGRTFGVICIYAGEADAFNVRELEILTKLADNLSFGIITLRSRSKRKQTENELRKLSLAVEQSPVSIVITDIAGYIEYGNPKVCEITGYTLDELIGKNPRILQSGKTPRETYQMMWDCITSRKVWRGEFQNKKKNGELYWEAATIAPILDLSGKITHYLAVKEDITERKKFIEDLKNAKEKAEVSDKLKSAFMHNISHELRTPLNGILGYSGLIAEPGISNEEKEQYYALIRTSSARLLNTINSYMDISMIASGTTEVHRQPFNLNEVLYSLKDQFQPICDVKHLEIYLKIPDEKNDITLHSDSGLLIKIMSHLLDNAVKFTHQGVITFGYTIRSGVLEFFVQDTGSGISKEAEKWIFENFNQEELSDTRGPEGSGLGLSIARGLVQLLGGQIRLKSEKGVGSTFFFDLPNEEIVIEISSSTKSEKALLKSVKPVILIAEDDESNYLYLEAILKKAPVTVLIADNGEKAVELCRAHPEISLILMDIKMPVMDGLEATREIKSFRKDIPIIAVTAFAMSGDENKALEAGCDDYLAKPVRKELLLDRLKRYGVTNVKAVANDDIHHTD
ncbi:MAG: PAS domain S-box protein [Bacteroidales bacterium]|jgi:PAS domain S-box-containing protein|nr:PAS domain S-box protein [Bacteroidales bacterium]